VIVDLAKLKVHYYGVSTAMLKNWVGITMFSTFNMSEDYWARICHEPYEPTQYEKTFGNDFMWREVVDLHRGVLYWREGVIHPTPQRRYLCIMDAINCAERYHDPDKPWPYWLHTMMASVDPVAIDAVGARLQRYDFRMIPIINNAHASSIGSDWAIGTGDPGQVRVVGDTRIDDTYDHQFLFDDRHGSWWSDWGDTVIHDLLPPEINSATAQEVGAGVWEVQAHIANAHVAFYYYGDDGTGAPRVVRLGKDGEIFSATIDAVGAGNGRVVAQDAYFNTASARIINMPVIALSTDRLSHVIHCSENAPDDGFTVTNIGADLLDYIVEADQPWLAVTPDGGDSTGEDDTITVSYACEGLMPGTHHAIITVSSGYAGNSPQTIAVTVVIETVAGDYDRDCDVDQSDFGYWQRCVNAPGIPPDPECMDCDLDADGFCNIDDLPILRGCMSGANLVADKTCDD